MIADMRTLKRAEECKNLLQMFTTLFPFQCYSGRDLSIVNESPSGSDYWREAWRLRYEASDSYNSPRSISNSSLREVDDELTGEELATYMQYVNNIGAPT